VDERLTSWEAERFNGRDSGKDLFVMKKMGSNKKTQKCFKPKMTVDAVAAAVILKRIIWIGRSKRPGNPEANQGRYSVRLI